MVLVACPGCSRHVRSSDARCPFCGSGPRVAARALLAVAAASLCAAHCKPDARLDPGALAASAASSAAAPSKSSDLDRFGIGQAAVYGAPPAAQIPSRGAVTLGPISPTEGLPSNAQRVLRGMVPGFRACYDRALQAEPRLSGTLRLEIEVAASGEVTAATVTSDHPAALSSCIEARARAGLFAASAQGATITTELTLTLGGPD